VLLADVYVSQWLDEKLHDGNGSEYDVPNIQTETASIDCDHHLFLVSWLPCKSATGSLTDAVGHQCGGQEYEDDHAEEGDLVGDLVQ